MQPIIIFWTAATKEEARAIAHHLLKNQLVGCVNLIDHVESLFLWKGKIESSSEVKVLLKSSENRFQEVLNYIESNCSYETPEVTYVNIASGSPNYLSWLEESII